MLAFTYGFKLKHEDIDDADFAEKLRVHMSKKEQEHVSERAEESLGLLELDLKPKRKSIRPRTSFNNTFSSTLFIRPETSPPQKEK